MSTEVLFTFDFIFLVCIEAFNFVPVFNERIFCCRSPVTHRMAPWVSKIFIHILPRILCIERPKKENPPHDDDMGGPPEVLTDVFNVPPDVDKCTGDYGNKRYSADYGIPSKFPLILSKLKFHLLFCFIT